MVSLDVFHSDPFRTIQLTQAIEKIPYLPDGLAAMGIFDDKPIRTEALMIEQRQGQLVILPFTDRGAPGTQRTTEQRNARYWSVPRIKMEDTIYAREVMGVREFGQETALMQVMSEVGRRFAGPTGLRANLNITQEYHRLAAVQGLLLDADGSVKYNWFNEFGITPNSEVVFNLAADTTGTLRPTCNQLVRSMKRKAQGAFTPASRVQALCGDYFWDKFITHPDVEKTYLNWMEASELRKGTAFESYSFAGIDWINYRGTDDTIGVTASMTNGSATVAAASLTGLAVGDGVTGPTIDAGTTIGSIDIGAGTFAMVNGGSAYNFTGTSGNYLINVGGGGFYKGSQGSYTGGSAISVPSNKAIFFPRKAPGIFTRALAPADSTEWVGQLGKPEYARTIPDRDRDEWVKIELSSYPLHICTRPETLFTGTADASAD